MTTVTLSLVLAAAFIHATWNLLAKRAGGRAPFVWLFAALSLLFYAPVTLAVIVIERPRLNGMAWGFFLGSGVLHLTYSLFLQRGYRVGDLSLVYPLARGTGPTLSTLAAILLLGERPTALALGGALLVVVGVFFLASGPGSSGRSRMWAVWYGLATGAVVAAYTVWDKHAVSTLLIPPLLLDFSSSLSRVVLLAPLAIRQRAEVCREWHLHRWEALGVGFLSPLSYILVLTALRTAPVSYVAPVRELSILIAALMGAHLLNEQQVVRRLTAACAIVAGVVALALG